jgi:hypothetical protein
MSFKQRHQLYRPKKRKLEEKTKLRLEIYFLAAQLILTAMTIAIAIRA